MSTAVNPNSSPDRLEKARQELHRMQARINFSTNLTLVVVLVLMGAMAGWLYYGSWMVDQVTEPKTLVNFVGSEINKKIPEFSDSISKEVQKSSPEWAKNLSDKVIQSMPDTRKKLEDFVLEQMDASIEKANLLTEEKLREFLKKHKPMLEKQFKELADNKKLPTAALDEIEIALLEDVDLTSDAGEVLKTLKDANKAWKAVLANKDLTEEGKLERRVWMLARRIQLEQLEPERLPEVLPVVAKSPPSIKTPRPKTTSAKTTSVKTTSVKTSTAK